MKSKPAAASQSTGGRPGADQLAVLHEADGSSGVSLFNVQTAEERRLRREHARGGYLRWTPDGLRLMWIDEAEDVERGVLALALIQYDAEGEREDRTPIELQKLADAFPEERIASPWTDGNPNSGPGKGERVAVSSAAAIAVNATIASSFAWPVGAEDGSGWRQNRGGLWWLERYDYGGTCGWTYHPGLDLNKDGTSGDQDRYEAVYAVAEGVVVDSGWYSSTWGNIIVIEHSMPDGSKVWSVYGHLEDRWVSSGNSVSRRQQIGRVGKGDGTLSAHLHHEIRVVNVSASSFPCGQPTSYVTDRYRNPETFLDANRASRCRHRSCRREQLRHTVAPKNRPRATASQRRKRAGTSNHALEVPQ